MPTKNKKSKGKGKGKGKGKKADKAGAKKAAVGDESSAVESEQRKGSLDSQMQRLKIENKQQAEADDDDALLEEAMKIAAAEKKELEEEASENCTHGYNPSSPAEGRFCDKFMLEYSRAFKAARDRGGGEDGVLKCLQSAFNFTLEKYPKESRKISNMECVISCCLSLGTKLILDGNYDVATRHIAACAKYFKDNIAIELRKMNLDAKVVELFHADEHTLVQFFRKRIPCKCLDERYKEVKTITKMGICFNRQCPIPDHRAVRSKMVYCTRCCQANYCSRTCQEAHWSTHKKRCGKPIKEQPTSF